MFNRHIMPILTSRNTSKTPPQINMVLTPMSVLAINLRNGSLPSNLTIHQSTENNQEIVPILESFSRDKCPKDLQIHIDLKIHQDKSFVDYGHHPKDIKITIKDLAIYIELDFQYRCQTELEEILKLICNNLRYHANLAMKIFNDGLTTLPGAINVASIESINLINFLTEILKSGNYPSGMRIDLTTNDTEAELCTYNLKKYDFPKDFHIILTNPSQSFSQEISKKVEKRSQKLSNTVDRKRFEFFLLGTHERPGEDNPISRLSEPLLRDVGFFSKLSPEPDRFIELKSAPGTTISPSQNK
jgi:hypothetical protein